MFYEARYFKTTAWLFFFKYRFILARQVSLQQLCSMRWNTNRSVKRPSRMVSRDLRLLYVINDLQISYQIPSLQPHTFGCALSLHEIAKRNHQTKTHHTEQKQKDPANRTKILQMLSPVQKSVAHPQCLLMLSRGLISLWD